MITLRSSNSYETVYSEHETLIYSRLMFNTSLLFYFIFFNISLGVYPVYFLNKLEKYL